MAKLIIEGNVESFFIKQEIATIKKCEKAIYNYRRYHSSLLTSGVWQGLCQAKLLLYRKRKRLKAKLK